MSSILAYIRPTPALLRPLSISRPFSTALAWRHPSPPDPSAKSRTSPGKTPVHGEREHPGYISDKTDPTSDHPVDLGQAPKASQPHSQTSNASTKAGPRHPGVEDMAKGAESKLGGSDAVSPTERTQKVWGPNSRTPEFNELEGKRNPVLDGGSHEGGLREDGKGSKT